MDAQYAEVTQTEILSLGLTGYLLIIRCLAFPMVWKCSPDSCSLEEARQLLKQLKCLGSWRQPGRLGRRLCVRGSVVSRLS